MRSRVSLSSFSADLDRANHPEQYEAARLSALECVVAVDVSALPTLQQAALLQMHESHVKRAVIARLLEDSQIKPDAPDYRALVECGLAVRNLGKRYHDLTAAGIGAAKALERTLCIRFGIHLLLEASDVFGPQSKFHCPCGWSVLVMRSRSSHSNAARSFHRHHATQAGMNTLVAALKPPRMVQG